MNAIIRWLRPVPSEPAPKPTHSAGRDSAPALTLVRPARVAPVLPVARVPRVVAGPDDPTPLFDEVMNSKWWPQPSAHPLFRWHHALHSQFEVARILDEFEPDELEEIARDAALDVDFGWESSGGAA